MISRIPFNEVQQGLYQLLSRGQTVPVYDSIPDGSEKMPYIWLGEFHGAPAEGNKTVVMHQVSQQLHVWSDQKGKLEVNGIMNDIVTLLTKYQLSLDGFRQVGPPYRSIRRPGSSMRTATRPTMESFRSNIS